MLVWARMTPQITLPVCVRCGAPVPFAPGSARAKCTYCGARLVIDASSHTRQTREAQRFPQLFPTTGVTPDVRRALWIVGLFVTFVALVPFVLALLRGPPKLASEPNPGSVDPGHLSTVAQPSTPPVPAAPHLSEVHPGTLLIDVDNDGREDAIGVLEREPPAERFLGAVSGADGHVLWRADATLDGIDSDDALRALVDDALLVVNPAGVLRDLDARSGVLRWTLPLAGPARDLCVHGDTLVLPMGDGTTQYVALATGTLAHQPPPTCEHAYTSRAEGPNFTTADLSEAAKLTRPADATLDVYHALVPLVGKARVALGIDRRSGAPAVAVVASGRLLWTARVAPGTDIAVPSLRPMRAAVRFDRLVMTYGVGHSAPGSEYLRVVCFDLASGRRIWDAEPAKEEGGPSTEVSISRDQRVFLRTAGGQLRILDLDRGATQLIIGGS
jgi:outer membrane protein assembly factor BamB/DNA-directed RNA polymerase subunit RPC12/RpoP